MPTGTWERLPEARRSAVLAAAEREFAERGFSQGSLNVIAREAGVSKGSLFQYFDGKADLFTYIAARTSTRVRERMEAAAADLPWETDFFGSLRRLNAAWVHHFYAHPVDLALTAAANLEPDRNARAAVRAAAGNEYERMLRPLIRLGVETGALAANADQEALLAHLMLMLPHVALAPHVSRLDPVLGMDVAEEAAAVEAANRMLGVLELAYAAR